MGMWGETKLHLPRNHVLRQSAFTRLPIWGLEEND